MGNDWNTEQELAIETRGKDILVAAAAGSGKTTVLVERIKRLVVDEGVPASSLLVLTFTNAAAREMKNRIRVVLEKTLEAEGISPERREALRRQLRDLPYAHIGTFHHFGISVIRRFFHLIGIEPGFIVCDDSKAFLMKKDALDELMEREYEAGRPGFLALLDKYTDGRRDELFKQIISDKGGLYEKLMSLPDPWGWADNAVSGLRMDRRRIKDTSFWRTYRAELIEALEKAYRAEKAAVGLLLESGLTRMALDYIEKDLKPIRSSLKYLLKDLKPRRTIEYVRTVMLPQKFSGLNGKKNDEKAAFEPIKDRVDLYREEAKKQVKGVKELLSLSLDENVFEISQTAGDAAELIRLTKEFSRIYSEMKAEEKVIDFTDIEHLCLDILQNKEACEAYRKEISYIFIDEYQDTNMLQESIVSRISRPGCTFMVGDVKQSIYRFRLADPDIFNRKYSEFTPASEMDEDDAEIVIDMNRNYRSKAPIRRYINKTFGGLMEGYDDRAALHGPEGNEDGTAGQDDGPSAAEGTGDRAAQEGDEPVLALLDTGGIKTGDVYQYEYDEETRNELLDMKHDELEAVLVASLIRNEIGKIFKPGKENAERPLRQGDVAILMRSNMPAQTFRKALNEAGLRCVVNENGGYFDTIEIEVFMALLSVLDNRQQDVPLLTVLHSEMFGFSAEDLARVRAGNPAGSYFRAFEAYCAGGRDAGLRKKCADALALIGEWRKLARVMPLPDLIWKIMLDSGYYLFTGALPDGKRRQANLRMLCDKAEAYAAGGEPSLYGFIKYVETIRAREVEMPEAKLTGSNEDAVRIMTMHKSKGLEFPMVVVTGLSRRLTYEKTGKFSFHKDLGLGLRYYREYGRDAGTAYRPTILQKLILDRVNEEEYAEQIRVLYVAMTRARDKLFLTGTVDDAATFAERAKTDLRTRSSYLNMISPHCGFRIYGLDGRPAAENARREDVDPAQAEYRPDEPEALCKAEAPCKTEPYMAEQAEEQACSSVTPTAGTVSEEERRALYEQLEYVYPYMDARSIRSKYSVTEINAMTSLAAMTKASGSAVVPDPGKAADPGSGMAEGSAVRAGLSVPAFAAGEHRMTAAERGTVYHAMMERIDFAEMEAENTVEAEKRVRKIIEGFRASGLFGDEEIDAVKPSNIASFFTSGIGRRAVFAARYGLLEKERPFTMKLGTKGETVLVQGKIDCFFIDSAGGEAHTVLVDYKSNHFDEERPEEEEKRLRAAYAGQMALYRRALEKAGLPPVKEAYLYLLAAGRLIDMSDEMWDREDALV